ncbi:MAG: hypothetical protein PHP50_03290 [Lachnospiraceae bacterium]|nr:hypothetical protein [Lachnospiraceae bacterium]
MKLSGITLRGYQYLAGQFVMFAIFFAGVGIYQSIVSGESLSQILPFYLMSFLSLYLYFSVSTIVDIAGKKLILKNNMVDYLENHMVSRLLFLNQKRVAEGKNVEKETLQNIEENILKKNKTISESTQEAEELEQLLQEMLL